jgi:hypothetical protein
MLVSWSEMPRSPGHAFYDKLQTVLVASDSDGFHIATNSHVGMATTPHGGRSTTIERGYSQVLRGRRSGCAPNWWSATSL